MSVRPHPVPAPKLPVEEVAKGGALEAWVSRLRSGVLGEVEGKPSTYVKDSLYLDACAEAIKIHNRTGYGRQH